MRTPGGKGEDNKAGGHRPLSSTPLLPYLAEPRKHHPISLHRTPPACPHFASPPALLCSLLPVPLRCKPKPATRSCCQGLICHQAFSATVDGICSGRDSQGRAGPCWAIGSTVSTCLACLWPWSPSTAPQFFKERAHMSSFAHFCISTLLFGWS